MRKLMAWLLFALLTISLAACGSSGKTGSSDTEADKAGGPVPYGIYQFLYLADENGDYLKEANEKKGTNGETIELRQMMYAAGDVWYFHIGEEGKGFLTDTASGIKEKEVTFSEGSFSDGSKTYAFKKSGDRFWYEESKGSWAVMEKASQGTIDLILAGKGGSVPLDEAKAGDLVCLGTYEQIPENGKTEPIYWRVLKKKDNELLLLSDKLLDAFSFQQETYDGSNPEISWKASSVRSFLNGDFIENCFTTEEAALMITQKLKNPAFNEELSAYWNFKKDPYKGMKKQKQKDGKKTEDKVFLLSVGEVLEYLGDEEGAPPSADYPFSELPTHPGRIAYVTRTVASGGSGYYDSATLQGAWLTRTVCDRGDGSEAVVYVNGYGQLFCYFPGKPLYIRPAMWVSAISVTP